MDFLLDSAWWVTLAAVLAASSAAALARPLKSARCILACLAWTALLAWTAMTQGTVAALASLTLSLLWACLLFLLTLLFSGVKLMAKKRYG
ncbi:MAG: hypothetical protein HGB20_03560 [Chlorobiaceae bacterium]|nr:hypothetical protein [Chlorobiaceae bacterium]